MSPTQTQPPNFAGTGSPREPGPWRRQGYADVTDPAYPGHPAGYSADPGLIEAVNTALILAKPLLLTGRPGTGKTELAERIAWEFGLGPVLRFEAQSLTEAQELFYRFDLVAQMADAQLAQRAGGALREPEHFLTFGALGKAILYAHPQAYPDLIAWDRRNDAEQQAAAHPVVPPGATTDEAPVAPRRSVVLIDEIDKAARDVPNDLLNGIDRMSFRIRELRNRLVAAPDDEDRKPIVVITSNSERDLPDPFLRRCVYYNIPDPTPDKLAEILRLRVPATLGGPPGSAPARAGTSPIEQLAPFYQALLTFFTKYSDPRAAHHLAYRPGTSEIIDWASALTRLEATPDGDLKDNEALIKRTLGAVLKHQDDRRTLREQLGKLAGLSFPASPA